MYFFTFFTPVFCQEPEVPSEERLPKKKITIFTLNTWLLPYSADVPLDYSTPARARRLTEMIETKVLTKSPEILFFQEVWSPTLTASAVENTIGVIRAVVDEDILSQKYKLFSRSIIEQFLTHSNYSFTAESQENLVNDQSTSVPPEVSVMSCLSFFEFTGFALQCLFPQIKMMDSGLLIATKGEIVKSSKHTYTKADGGDKYINKGALAALIKFDDGRWVIAVTTHMDSRHKEGTRKLQLTELDAFITDFKASCVKDSKVVNPVVVIAGDFNMPYEDFKDILKYQISMFDKYVDGWANKTPIPTYAGTYGGEARTIDYVFVDKRDAKIKFEFTPDDSWKVTEKDISEMPEETKDTFTFYSEKSDEVVKSVKKRVLIDKYKREHKATDHAGIIATIEY